MRLGKLYKLVVIKKPSEVQEDSGELDVGYLELGKEWASIEPLTGREFFSAQQAQSTVSVRVTMRFRRDVTAKMLIVYKPYADMPEDIYEINAVVNSFVGNRSMQLLCTQMTAKGLRHGGSNG